MAKTGYSWLLMATALGLAAAGCSLYRPTTVHSPAGDVEYRLSIRHTPDDRYYSDLSSRGRATLRLSGKSACIGIDPSGTIIAVGMLPQRGPNEHGRHYLGNEHQVVVVNADDLTVLHRWRLKPPGMPEPGRPGGYVSSIVRFDKIAISHDRKLIATYYWKGSWRRSVVALWGLTRGNWLREFALPAPDASLRGVIHTESLPGLAFSPSGRRLAATGCWPVKDPKRASNVDGFLAVWDVAGGAGSVFRTNGHTFVRDLCFDGAGKRLACWGWTGQGKRRQAVVLVWCALTGKQLHAKKVAGRVSGIHWDTRREAFSIRLASGQTAEIR